MDYTTLVGAKTVPGSIKSWVNWNKVPSEEVLIDAQNWIFQGLKSREMKELTSGSLAIDDTSITLPAGWRGLITLRLTGDYRTKLIHREIDAFESKLVYETDGSLSADTPFEVATISDRLLLNRKADQVYPYNMYWWKAPDKLSEDNETNFLTDRYSQMLRAACLYMANLHRKDQQEAATWQQIAASNIQDANREADFEMSDVNFELHWDAP